MPTEPGSEPRLFLPEDADLAALDAELHALLKGFQASARRARAIALRAMKDDDLLRWRRFNNVARAWEAAAGQLFRLSCPFSPAPSSVEMSPPEVTTNRSSACDTTPQNSASNL